MVYFIYKTSKTPLCHLCMEKTESVTHYQSLFKYCKDIIKSDTISWEGKYSGSCICLSVTEIMNAKCYGTIASRQITFWNMDGLIL